MTQRIELEEMLTASATKQLALSGDGTLCALGGGEGKAYTYLVDLKGQLQHKLTSESLTFALAPCFINGDTEYRRTGIVRS